jgi:hypothetical protein
MCGIPSFGYQTKPEAILQGKIDYNILQWLAR